MCSCPQFAQQLNDLPITGNICHNVTLSQLRRVSEMLTFAHFRFKQFIKHKAAELDEDVVDMNEAYTSVAFPLGIGTRMNPVPASRTLLCAHAAAMKRLRRLRRRGQFLPELLYYVRERNALSLTTLGCCEREILRVFLISSG